MQDFYQYMAGQHRGMLQWIGRELNDLLTSSDTRYQFNMDTIDRLNRIVNTIRSALSSGGGGEPPPKGGHAGMT